MVSPDCIDCSEPLTESSLACLVSNGIKIVGRHYTHDQTSLTLAEARLISAAGLQIVAIYESDDPHLGNSEPYGAGDWARAVALASAAQQPADSYIYIHVPFDDPTKYPALLEYLDGFGGAGPQGPGIYGSAQVCLFGIREEVSAGAWQTGPGSIAEYYMIREQATAQSLCGITCNTAKLGGSTNVLGGPISVGSFTVPAA